MNHQEFRTQKEAIDYFKAMLGRYRNGQSVTEHDLDILLALIERHPEAGKKIGCGIKRLYKDKTDMPTSCFWIERIDGSKTDFSYRTAICAKGKSLYQEFAEACRHAVQDDLRLAKERHFKAFAGDDGRVECEITGERIALYESHVDHKKPLTFQVLVKTFIGANGIEISREILSMSRDAQFQTAFADLDIKERFAKYHQKMAQLRIIKADRNLSLGGSERILKIKNPVKLNLSRA